MLKNILRNKVGGSLVEMMLVMSMVSIATYHILEINTDTIEYNEGKHDAQLAKEALNEALLLHPSNSMISMQNFSKVHHYAQNVQGNNNQGNNNQGNNKFNPDYIGFSAISNDEAIRVKERVYLNGLNSQKNKISIEADKQWFSIESTLTSKNACNGFINNLKNDWIGVSINGVSISPTSKPFERSKLCKGKSNATYEYTLNFCFALPTLPCTK